MKLRQVPKDGTWHVVTGGLGGTTAEQYARRYNAAHEQAGVEDQWLFGYKSYGTASELWAVWTGTVTS
jgi:transketolase C-terminal domain/subunit